MIRLLHCRTPEELDTLYTRETGEAYNVDETVRAIIDDVRREGDKALLRYTKQFDGPELDTPELPGGELDAAYGRIDGAFRAVLERARENIAAYHRQQKRAGYVMDGAPGVVMGQRVLPLDRVGVYVPGGTASYASTVLMDVLPAKIAGVGEVVMATPPGRDGRVPDDILAAARVAGVDRVFRMGGAQAVAALSYGTGTVPRVDKIVGPGNIYVATAKRMVYGQVAIDMIAGPSEILILADEAANPAHIAADMLSQAEHDRLSASILITTSEPLAQRVRQELEKQLSSLPRAEIARHAIEHNSALIVAQTLEQAAALSNHLAPEHLEICTAEPFALLPLIRHAGSVFLGPNAPEALADYLAGPNHTLPTNGTARFSSPLGVDDFVKRSSFLYYDRQALEKVAGQVALFARREGLEAHARSVEARVSDQDQ